MYIGLNRSLKASAARSEILFGVCLFQNTLRFGRTIFEVEKTSSPGDAQVRLKKEYKFVIIPAAGCDRDEL